MLPVFSSYNIIDARMCPEHIDSIIEWQRMHWGDSWVSHIQKQGTSEPFEIVAAISEQNLLVGCAFLLPEAFGIELSPDPWLCGIVVSPRHRNIGLGSALALHVAYLAGSMMFKRLWVQPDRSFELFEGIGWHFYERSVFKDKVCDSLVLDLSGHGYKTESMKDCLAV